MAREIETGGIPVVQISSVPDMPRQVGVSRIVWGQGIPYPMGNPDLTKEQAKAFARTQWEVALKALETEVKGPTYFQADFGNVIRH